MCVFSMPAASQKGVVHASHNAPVSGRVRSREGTPPTNLEMVPDFRKKLRRHTDQAFAPRRLL